MSDNMMGERIRALLESKEMTQKELATKADITEAAVSHYIKGDRVPRSTVLSRIASAMGVSLDYLMDGIPNDVKDDLLHARKLIARNVDHMTKAEKMELINILLGDDDG